MYQSSRAWRGSLLAVTVVAVSLPVADGDPLAQQRERYTVTGSEVAVYNLAGVLRVVPGSGAAVTVEVTRGGRDADQLKVETGPRGPLQTLRVIYPGRRVVYPEIGRSSNSSLEVSPDGTFGDHVKDILGFGGRRVVVTGGGSGLHAWADLRISVPKGQKIRVHHVAGDVNVANVEGTLAVDHAMGSLTTEGTKGTLVLDTGSGEVKVSKARGDVTVDTGSGHVVVSDVRGTRLHLDTGSGGIQVDGAVVDELVADTGSGNVHLTHIRARDVRLDTGSGSVHVDLDGDIERLVADTGSGGVTVAAPTDLGARFEIDTGSGRIDVDFPHEVYQVERDHVSGKIGDGRGSIRIDTGSGGVRLLKRITSSARPPSAVLGMLAGPEIA